MKEWGEFMYRGTVPGLSRVATVTATGALAGCVILQIWSLLCQVREHLGAVQGGRPVELWVTALYLALVILFSWCAARGESRAYRAAALSAAALQLFAAAACAVLACAQPAAGGTELARTALGLLLLPMNAMEYLRQGESVPFWCFAAFFAVNTAMVYLPGRESRRTAPAGAADLGRGPMGR